MIGIYEGMLLDIFISLQRPLRHRSFTLTAAEPETIAHERRGIGCVEGEHAGLLMGNPIAAAGRRPDGAAASIRKVEIIAEKYDYHPS